MKLWKHWKYLKKYYLPTRNSPWKHQNPKIVKILNIFLHDWDFRGNFLNFFFFCLSWNLNGWLLLPWIMTSFHILLCIPKRVWYARGRLLLDKAKVSSWQGLTDPPFEIILPFEIELEIFPEKGQKKLPHHGGEAMVSI